MKKNPAIIVVIALSTAAWTYQKGQARQAAALYQIVALDARLAANAAQRAQGNASTLRGIADAVARDNYRSRDAWVLSQSEQILKRSRSLADTLRQWQQTLRVEAHEPATGALHHPQAPTALALGRAARLGQALNRYSRFIQAYIPWAPMLAPEVSPRPETTWLYAEGAPLAAALGSLTRLEAQAHRLAQDALSQQAQKVGYSYLPFNKIGAVAVAVSNTVAPGGVYEARLFISHVAAGFKPKMSADGQPIAVGYDAQGTVELRVPPLRPGQPDTVRAHWRGRITKRGYPTDSTMQLDVPYYIVKPRTR